jgi:murein DD-endopeptidase MepM/ murein hydrolase activator NlpD
LSSVWGVAATGLVAARAWQDVNAVASVSALSQTYEERIAALEAEKAALEAQVRASEDRSAAALVALATRHDSVSSTLASEKALSASVEHLRLRVATLTAERDGLLGTTAASSARIAELEQAIATAEADRRDLHDALSRVAVMLDATTDARDGALSDAQIAEGALGKLEAGVEQQRDLQTRLLAQIEAAAASSIGPLEKLFGSVGIDVNRMLEGMRRSDSGAGGPFIPPSDTLAAMPEGEGERVVSVLSQLERVALLQQAARKMPFAKPVNGLRLTSGFGTRRDPFNGRRSLHHGIDFAGPRGTPILAPADGVVVFAGAQRGYGRTVKIRHANGFETLYAHLNRAAVRVGQTVRRGQKIAELGNTGRSTGPHLHYEVHYNGRPVNPLKFIEAARHVL